MWEQLFDDFQKITRNRSGQNGWLRSSVSLQKYREFLFHLSLLSQKIHFPQLQALWGPNKDNLQCHESIASGAAYASLISKSSRRCSTICQRKSS